MRAYSWTLSVSWRQLNSPGMRKLAHVTRRHFTVPTLRGCRAVLCPTSLSQDRISYNDRTRSPSLNATPKPHAVLNPRSAHVNAIHPHFHRFCSRTRPWCAAGAGRPRTGRRWRRGRRWCGCRCGGAELGVGAHKPRRASEQGRWRKFCNLWSSLCLKIRHLRALAAGGRGRRQRRQRGHLKPVDQS